MNAQNAMPFSKVIMDSELTLLPIPVEVRAVYVEEVILEQPVSGDTGKISTGRHLMNHLSCGTKIIINRLEIISR